MFSLLSSRKPTCPRLTPLLVGYVILPCNLTTAYVFPHVAPPHVELLAFN